MSTRAAIIEKTETGYRGIYLHFDGSKLAEQCLAKNYQDPIKVTELINQGDLSSLGETTEPEHTVAYCRDRNEPKRIRSGQTAEQVAGRIDHSGHIYIFEDGTWTHNGRPIEIED